MSRRAHSPVFLLAACVALSACLSDDERRTINGWLTCEECVAGERQAVLDIGWKAVPRLAGALQQGPSAQRLLNMERQITSSWNLLPAPGMSLAETIELYLGNYEAVYRSRAALSLGDFAVGGSIARGRAGDELQEALTRDSTDRATGGTGVFRDDVLRVIGASHARALPPDISSVEPVSGLVGSRVRLNGSNLANPGALTIVTLDGVDVSLFVVSSHRDSVILLVPSGGPAGSYPLAVRVGDTVSASAGWTQIGTQEADDPDNDDPSTAPLVQLPLDVVGTFAAGETDDIYNVSLSGPETLEIDLDWDDPGIDLDVAVADNPPTAFQCVDGATLSKPESSTCSLAAGDYSIMVNDFSAMGVTVSYRLRVRAQ